MELRDKLRLAFLLIMALVAATASAWSIATPSTLNFDALAWIGLFLNLALAGVLLLVLLIAVVIDFFRALIDEESLRW